MAKVVTATDLRTKAREVIQSAQFQGDHVIVTVFDKPAVAIIGIDDYRADYAEVIWNEDYRVPHDVTRVGGDVCDYPLARNLIQFAVALASEAIVRFVLQGQWQSYSFTLRDLRVNVEA